jgi:hypothetical protein
MSRVVFSIFALVIIFHVLKWFFTAALPEIFRVIGTLLDWLVEVIAGLYSGSVSSWKALKGWIAARSGSVPEEGHGADQSLLDSSAASDINKEANISQPQKPMWPFGPKDTPPTISSSASPVTPVAQNIRPQAAPVSLNAANELTKTKADLFRAQNQLKSLEDTVQELTHENAALKQELARFQQMALVLEDQIRSLEHSLHDFASRYHAVSDELEKLKPFAAMKTDQRRMTYTVSVELHKKWQSILRETKRLQVLELLGQPTEIVAVSLAGAAPIQLIRKGVPAPRAELMQHVTNLVQGDTLLKDWVRGVGRTAWVYSDDTLAPGVIFFASESDGGQVFRIFPPEC